MRAKTARFILARPDPSGREGRTINLYHLCDRTVSSTGYVVVETLWTNSALFLFASDALGERLEPSNCLGTLMDATDPDQLLQLAGYTILH
jgi:hypothetical protein